MILIKVMLKILKKVIKIALCLVLVLALIVGAYAAYVFSSYYRVADNLQLNIQNSSAEKPEIGKEYTLVSFNIGFGAYEPDYSFFMDGGTESRAFSKERLLKNMNGIGGFLSEQDADFLFLQEVDEKGTRTYQVNERQMLTDKLSDYTSVWAQNWDSPYLAYPLTSPHGKNVAGIMTMSRFGISSAIRKSLPIEETVMKLVDLDRCYSVSRIPLENGKELVAYNAHLSAYTSDGKIAEEQIKLLAADMSKEYKAGNYVICGGDFNKDLLGNAGEVFGISGEDQTWAQPFPKELLKDTGIRLVVPFDESNPVPSCRNADAPYNENQFVLTVDGFLVSDNVKVVKSDVIDVDFKYSDHNPVYLTFVLE